MSDRLIAERMGWIACSGDHWGDKIHWKRTLGCAPFDLADARDREAVIAWLNAQGLAVMTTECAAAYVISIHETEPDGTPKIEAICMARGTAGQKVEAFRAAVLAATEAQDG